MSPLPPLRWGVVGTGGIAATVSADLALVEGAVLHAVTSRDPARASAFAERHGFEGTAVDVAQLAAEVDVVYVATPHPAHLGAALTALEAGTPVLVEKPVTATLAGAEQLAALSRERGVFAMEAMWTRFLPTTVALLEEVGSGRLGRVRALHAAVGAPLGENAPGRLLDPALGGGALLDIGVYPVWLAHLLLGPVASVSAVGELSDEGVDVLAALLLGHEGGGASLLSASLVSSSGHSAVIEGSEGRLRVVDLLRATPGFTVHAAGGESREVLRDHRGTGYLHMLEHVQECVRAGLTESPLHPLSTTLAVMTVLDDALRQLGAVPAADLG